MIYKFNSLKQIFVVFLASVIAVLSASIPLLSQDPIYSQFYNSPLQINPAFAGTTYAPKFGINYRNQWALIPNAYNTFSASYDQYLDKANSGVGFFLTGDSAGDGIYTTIKAAGIYSYNLVFSDYSFLKIGIEAGFVQGRWNWDKLIFFDQLDPETGASTPGGTPIPSNEIRPDNLNVNYLDISTGLLFYTPDFYVGLSLKHLNRPSDILKETINDVYGGLPMRLSLQAGSEIRFKRRNKRGISAFLSPNILYVQQGDFKQINLGSYFGVNGFYMGAWLRHTFGNTDAAILSFGVRSGKMRFSYSYDLTLSELSVLNSGGSHEVGIIINLEGDNQRRKINYNDCFSIFR